MGTEDLPRLLASAASAVAIVVCGALYAGLLALGRLRLRRRYVQLAYAAYVLLVLATLGFAWSLRLAGPWWVLIGLLLIGYLLAPRAIWRLCVDTHAAEHAGETR